MKTLSVTLSVTLLGLTLLGAVGCGQNASEDPEATAPAKDEQSAKPGEKKPIAGEADNTFSLSMPFEAVTLAQGEEQSVLIGIDRGESFAEQVDITVSDLPAGVTLETADPAIKPGSTDVTLVLKAADDASLGDFTAKMTGHTASSAPDFSEEFMITVTENENTEEEE
ncbi:MAG: hypothetical protein ACQESR_01915 [Planctomycetota bacterium]